MIDFLSSLPEEGLIILCVAFAGFLLLVGVRICKHGLTLVRGNLQIELEAETPTTAATMEARMEHTMDSGTSRIPRGKPPEVC